MGKGYHSSKLISSLSITVLLLYFIINTSSSKIIFIPFLICSIAMTGKHISLFFNNSKLANLFSKMFTIGFLAFLAGFLIFVLYICFRNKNYILLIISLLFCLFGFFFLKKRFINDTIMKSNTGVSFPIVVSTFLVGIVFFSGIVMLIFGIKDTYELNLKTKDYIVTKGFFDHYDVFDVDDDGITYRLTYVYNVDGKQYSLTTDYGTNYIPEANSNREIKYNPNNPNEAILLGTNSKNGLIYFGAFFTLGSLTFVIAALTIMGYFDKFKIDVLGLYIGVLFIIVGIGIILFQTGTTRTLFETVKSFGLWMLIPIMLILVGVIQTIKCITKVN